jgi:hypothetical protein
MQSKNYKVKLMILQMHNSYESSQPRSGQATVARRAFSSGWKAYHAIYGHSLGAHELENMPKQFNRAFDKYLRDEKEKDA